jgi:hypothetical protein
MLAGILGAWVLGAVAVAATADIADSPSNPYHSIVVRNVFVLKDPPPPPEPPSTKPPTPKFVLQGVTTFGGNRAIFKSGPVAGKPGEQPKEQSYMLREGERDGEVEVVRIDTKACIVEIKHAGVAMTLDFTNNAAKVVAAAPMPGIPGAPPVIPPPGIGVPQANPLYPGGKANVPPAVRQTRQNPGVAMMQPGGLPGGVPFSAPGPFAAQTQQQGNPGVTRDQQEVLMELLRDQQKNSPVPLPPMPPTSLTPAIEAANAPTVPSAPGPAPGAPPSSYLPSRFPPPLPPAPPGRPF